MDNAGFWSVVLVERSRHLYTASCLSLFRTGVFQREREREQLRETVVGPEKDVLYYMTVLINI